MLSLIRISKYIVKLAISQAVGLLKHDSYWLCAMRLNWAGSLKPNKKSSRYFPPKGTLRDLLSFPRCHLLAAALCPNDHYPLSSQERCQSLFVQARVLLGFNSWLPAGMEQGRHTDVCPQPATGGQSLQLDHQHSSGKELFENSAFHTLINLALNKDTRLWLKTPGHLVLLLNGKKRVYLFYSIIL